MLIENRYKNAIDILPIKEYNLQLKGTIWTIYP